jgi:hypothetical protein
MIWRRLKKTHGAFLLNPMCVFPTTKDETYAQKENYKPNSLSFFIVRTGEIKNDTANQGSNSTKQKEKFY